MNILITGGCGFIGVNLAVKLHADGHSIRVLDNLSVGQLDVLESLAPVILVENNDSPEPPRIGEVQVLIGNICDIRTARQAVKGIDAVVHLAAQCGVIPSIDDPSLDCQVNIIGTLNMLMASAEGRVSKFVFASSGAPLGDQEPPVNEMKVPKPLSPYGASKLAGEGYCCAFHATYGLKTIALRFSNVYGPRATHKDSVIPLFFKRALEGLPLVIYGDGRQTRDFIYIDDLCDAIVACLETNLGGEIFQIATSKENSINSVARLVQQLVERDLGRRVKIFYQSERKGEIYRNYSEIAKARQMLGYVPKVNLSAGMERTWQWFRENYHRL